uniref:Uncharacterized protein n=1 Tax=Araucaria cunninghamii TaxID=56994 RepID=A0A0D6QUV8_ARACU
MTLNSLEIENGMRRRPTGDAHGDMQGPFSGDAEGGSLNRDMQGVSGNEGDNDGSGHPNNLSVEAAFEGIPVPPWWEQITLRGLAVSAVLGGLFCIITHKLNLTTGVIPSLNVAAGLLGFFLIKTWTKLLERVGLLNKMFTRQENTVIQTCVVACYGIAFSGGFDTYILGMDENTRQKTGPELAGNTASAVKNPQLGWIFAFIFTVSFLGLFSVVPLRKIMVIDYKLTYPSGTATAILINSFHTPQGEEKAKKQVKCLGKYFVISFLWSFFKWFYVGDGDCGFDNFPIFGLKAKDNMFYSDFSLVYVGAGMICPHLINISLLLGGIISFGLMWPLIRNNEGDWYPKGLESTDLKGLYGYKVFVAIALILGDGLYNFAKIFCITLLSLYRQHKEQKNLPLRNPSNVIGESLETSSIDVARRNETKNMYTDEASETLTTDYAKRNMIFMRDSIPFWAAASGYVLLAAISVGVMPQIFPPVKWYYVLVGYIVAPVLGFCNAYGCGLTDWSLASNYGKLGLFVFAAWVGEDGGVIAGLALMGVMMVIVATAADLMQDFKTGYLTLSSPRSMFVSQVIGTIMGCILAPLTFWMYWKAFDIGNSKEYKAPYAKIFRQMALIGVNGFSALPKHCLPLCYGFFLFAIVVNLIRDIVPQKVSRYIPIPMAMAIPFYIGPYFAIDMFVGTVIVFVWTKLNKEKADLLVPAVASGLICGDGLWTVPSAILAMAKVKSPICMAFLSRTAATNTLGI